MDIQKIMKTGKDEIMCEWSMRRAFKIYLQNNCIRGEDRIITRLIKQTSFTNVHIANISKAT